MATVLPVSDREFDVTVTPPPNYRSSAGTDDGRKSAIIAVETTSVFMGSRSRRLFGMLRRMVFGAD